MEDFKYAALVILAMAVFMAILCVITAPAEEQAEFSRTIAETIIGGPDSSYVREEGK